MADSTQQAIQLAGAMVGGGLALGGGAIGAIQAFIFALLTILYFDTAMSEAH